MREEIGFLEQLGERQSSPIYQANQMACDHKLKQVGRNGQETLFGGV
jgi:hypothetical protein